MYKNMPTNVVSGAERVKHLVGFTLKITQTEEMYHDLSKG